MAQTCLIISMIYEYVIMRRSIVMVRSPTTMIISASPPLRGLHW